MPYSFTAKESNTKYYYNIFDLDVNEQKDCIDVCYDVVDEWNGGEYRPDFNINICVNDQIKLSRSVKNNFRDGLARIVSSSWAFIMTNGFKGMTTSILSEAVSNAFKYPDNESFARNLNHVKKLKILGVCRWRKPLFSQDFQYDFEDTNDSGTPILDPNHSHFIFVKKLNDEYASHEFRSELMKKLFQSDELCITIVLNGDKSVLKTVLSSVESGIPVLLIRESRGAADLLANLIDKFKDLSFEEKNLLASKHDKDLEEKFYKQFEKEIQKGSYDLDDIKRLIQLYYNSIEENNVISINAFELADDIDLEIAVLKTLSDGNGDKSEKQTKCIDIMRLSLKWNKVEIAKQVVEYLNENNSYFDYDDYFALMESALVDNRPEFFGFYLDVFKYDKNFMSNFVNAQRLYYLYNFKNNEEDVKLAPFAVLFRKKEFFSFKDIRKILNELLMIEMEKNFFSESKEVLNFCKPFNIENSLFSDYINSQTNPEGFEVLMENPSIINPSINLFIWTLLFNRIEIAKILLPEIENQIGFSLIASILMEKIYDKTRIKMFLDISEEFETYAIEILDLFDRKEDDSLNYRLLQTKIDYFNRNILRLAYSGERQKFITTFAVQKCLLDLWNNGYVEDYDCRVDANPNELNFHDFGWKMLVSYGTFGLAAPFLLYSNQKQQKSDPTENSTKQVCLVYENENSLEPTFEKEELIPKNKPKQRSYFYKFKNFVCSPRNKFFNETVMYFVFIMLFSYFILCEFKFEKIVTNTLNNQTNETTFEISEPADISWVEYLLIFWVFTFYCRLISSFVVYVKMKVWSVWENLNIAGCLLFIFAISLRFISHFNRSKDLFIAARLILCLDLVAWILRLLNLFTCFESLGPKLVMIGKMIKDLLTFVAIILIFLIGYGVTNHALLFPASELDSNLFSVIFEISYWPIFGDKRWYSIVSEREKVGEIPFDARIYGSLMTMAYMFLANILLLNLLIAMFSNTFSSVEQNAFLIWKFDNFKLIYEYRLSELNNIMLFPLPSPLNLINVPVFLIKLVWHSRKSNKNQMILMHEIEDKIYQSILEKVKSYSEKILKNKISY